MSCFVMSQYAHARIADTLAALLNSSILYYQSGYFGRLSPPENLFSVFESCRDQKGFREYNPTKIYSRLYSENVRAYNSRYKENDSEIFIPDFPKIEQPYHPAKWGNYHQTIEPWHYQFLKDIDCLVYQLSEDGTNNTELHQALKELANELCYFIARNTDEYEQSEWGE